jgi:hypothetical protein
LDVSPFVYPYPLFSTKEALSSLSPEELVRVRRIQGFEVSGLAAIFHSVPHFRGHTQEIVHLTRLQLGDAIGLPGSRPPPSKAAWKDEGEMGISPISR